MLPNRNQSIEILKKNTFGNFDGILKHSLAVEKLALHIASQIKCNIDIVSIGAILHDIGRYKFPPKSDNAILHAVEGAKILHKLNIDKRVVEITKNHIGAGITVDDIKKQNLPLPKVDYIPKTIEEKIVAYADNCVKYDEILTIKYPIKRFSKSLGANYAKRVILLHNELISNGFVKNLDNSKTELIDTDSGEKYV